MANWPTSDDYTKRNQNRAHEAITVAAPAYDDNADHSKTVEEVNVEQQWRDVKRLGLDKDHALSINRDASEVTADPYTP